MRSVTVITLVCAAAPLVQTGCQPGSAASQADEHLEHHIPEHRPSDFAQGVAQIELRLPQIAGRTTDTRSAESDRQEAELRDIIEWIPDLAGDSDMKRAAWDQVHAAARELLQQYDRALPTLRQGGQPLGPSLTEPLARLRALAQADSAAQAPAGDPTRSAAVSGDLKETSQ